MEDLIELNRLLYTTIVGTVVLMAVIVAVIVAANWLLFSRKGGAE